MYVVDDVDDFVEYCCVFIDGGFVFGKEVFYELFVDDYYWCVCVVVVVFEKMIVDEFDVYCFEIVWCDEVYFCDVVFYGVFCRWLFFDLY